MGLFHSLYRSIIPNPDEHPERLNATMERVQEVGGLPANSMVSYPISWL